MDLERPEGLLVPRVEWPALGQVPSVFLQLEEPRGLVQRAVVQLVLVQRAVVQLVLVQWVILVRQDPEVGQEHLVEHLDLELLVDIDPDTTVCVNHQLLGTSRLLGWA